MAGVVLVAIFNAWPARLVACALLIAGALHSQGFSLQGEAGSGSRVEGVVVDQSSAPVPDAEVFLKVGSSVVAQARTGSDGNFVFDRIMARQARLTVRARGFAPSEQQWVASTAGTKALRIVLRPASVSGEVTVTATGTETRLGETAASVSVLSSQELAVTAAATLDDALRQVPGFNLFRRSSSRTANPTSQGVSLRGVGASGASRALVLADGIPLNDPFGGWVYWDRVPRESIERVEVLRGAASDLYGSGALGGVVQIMTRTPDRPTLALETSYGNERAPEVSIFTGGRLGKWGASAAAEAFRTDGYILVDPAERGSIDTPAGVRYHTINLTLDRRIGPSGRIFIRGLVFHEARPNGTPLQTNDTTFRMLSAGANWQSERAGQFSFRASAAAETYDQVFSAVAADRNSETLTRTQRVPAQSVGLAAQWSRPLGRRQTVVAGLEAREVRGASNEVGFDTGRATSSLSVGGRQRTVGVFAEDIVRITSRLVLTGGARLDRWSEFDASSATRSLLKPGSTVLTGFPDRRESALSPRVSVLYTLTDHVSLAASATRAFRQPTLNELYRSFRVGNVVTQANENLRAERLTGGEAGTNFTLLKRRLVIRSALFWSEITDPVANVTLRVTPSLITRQRQNLGRTRSRGAEIESEMRFNDRWELSGSYLFADATVARFPGNTTLEGLRIPQVPRHQFTAQARFTSPSGLQVGVQAQAAGAQFDDDQNLFRLGSYLTLNALVAQRLARNLDLFAAAENVTNTRYDTGRTPVRTIGPPVLFRIGVRLRLGAN